MREIIYIQAGNFSNHIGTHFWNAQESYFAYGEDADEPVVNHDISFREGLSSQNEQTYCPRLLLFDTKSNFGAMSKYNELYSDSSASNNGLLASGASWNGPVAEFKQNPIAKSDYQRRLEEGDPGDDEGSANAAVKSQEVRFWSDYNRVYYHPRSLHALSDLPEWEANKGDWNYGKSTFQKYEAEIEFSEGDFRHFIEECDNFQGFQMQFDNSMFGPFSVAMLEMIRDELPKIPVLAFPVLSGTNPSRIDVDEVQARKSVLLDALCLQTLSELVSQAVPTQSPSSWQLGRWSEHIDLDTKSLFETSAVLSAHIESATLPLRLKHKSEDLSNLSQHLNWAQNTRISHLSGILPFIDGDDMVTHCHDFSAVLEPATNKGIQVLAQRNTTRGLSAAQRHKAEELFSKSGLASPYLSNLHSITYPLPSSYPHFFRPLPSLNSLPPPKRARPMPSSLPQRTSTPVISSLTTTTSTGHLFKAHARFLGECIRKRVGMGDGGGGEGVGLDADELKEVRDALWALADAYLGAEAEADDGEGEEEEGSVSVEEDG